MKFRVENAVARVTLARPEHNLLNERMLVEIAAAINSVAEQSAVKLIVLDSAGKTFSGGIELGEYTARRVFQLLDAFHVAFAAMLDTAKPLLVVVNGPAFGGGAELAALGDLVIATPKAKFAQPEIKLGVFPPLAAAILPNILGPKVASELVLTGETMTAERARELGGEGDGAVGPGVDDGEEGDSGRDGAAVARGRAEFDESFLERAVRFGGFAGGLARAGGETRDAVEESLT